MSRTKFCIMAVVTLATFGFAVYVHSSNRLVKGYSYREIGDTRTL